MHYYTTEITYDDDSISFGAEEMAVENPKEYLDKHYFSERLKYLLSLETDVKTTYMGLKVKVYKRRDTYVLVFLSNLYILESVEECGKKVSKVFYESAEVLELIELYSGMVIDTPEIKELRECLGLQ